MSKKTQLIIKQDLAEPNYRFFQLLAESENGLIEQNKVINGYNVRIKCSYKTQLGKISRTTADLQILLGALIRQNNFNPTIENISQKDMLFYLNKEAVAKNYQRLREDLALLMSLSINIESDEIKEGETKAKKNDEDIGYPVVIVKYKLKKYQRKGNYIQCADEFANQVKNKYIIPLPPKEVFFKLNTPTKYVCERLIARLQPKGIGYERKFKTNKLEFDVDYFAAEILGYNYKREHSKRNTTSSVLKELDFLVKDFNIEKQQTRGNYKVHIWFYSYNEYIKNVEVKMKESKYYEEPELFPKEELDIIEHEMPQIFSDLIAAGVSESKVKSIYKKGFEVIKDNKEAVIQEYQEKELKFNDYIKAKFVLAKMYSDKQVREGNSVNFEAIFMRAIQNNWENKVQQDKEVSEKAAREEAIKKAKIKELEKRKKKIEDKWEKIISQSINKQITANPTIVDNIWKELENTREGKSLNYDKTLTPMENYKNKIFIMYEINSRIIEKDADLTALIKQRNDEINELNEKNISLT